MVGILCNPSKERFFTKTLHGVFGSFFAGEHFPAMVFSLPNVNLLENHAYGSLISDNIVTQLQTELPPVIYNFSVQRSRSDIKKLRSLTEAEGLVLFNSVNQYNQRAVMEMLSSDPALKRYCMPATPLPPQAEGIDLSAKDRFLLRPENGLHYLKTIYCRKKAGRYELYNRQGSFCCAKDIAQALRPYLRAGKWLLHDTPGLAVSGGRLAVFRTYMQKDSRGAWSILLNTRIADEEKEMEGPCHSGVLIRIMELIGCFIPDICFCHLDYILDAKGRPFLLGLGGWENTLLAGWDDGRVQRAVVKNIMECARSVMAAGA